MQRKWTTLAVAMFAVVALVTGFALADDESPLEKLMEAVGKENAAIKKAIRTKVSYAKADRKEISQHVDELIDLGKQARKIKAAAEKQKKPYEEWTKAMDDFLKKTEEFKDVMAKPATNFDQAKKSFATVTASCNSCHTAFKVADEP
jgi:cytochrome c556